MSGRKYAVDEPVPASARVVNRTKGQPFHRVMRAKYDEKNDRLTYYHPTKGRRSRAFTQDLFAQMVAG